MSDSHSDLCPRDFWQVNFRWNYKFFHCNWPNSDIITQPFLISGRPPDSSSDSSLSWPTSISHVLLIPACDHVHLYLSLSLTQSVITLPPSKSGLVQLRVTDVFVESFTERSRIGAGTWAAFTGSVVSQGFPNSNFIYCKNSEEERSFLRQICYFKGRARTVVWHRRPCSLGGIFLLNDVINYREILRQWEEVPKNKVTVPWETCLICSFWQAAGVKHFNTHKLKTLVDQHHFLLWEYICLYHGEWLEDNR